MRKRATWLCRTLLSVSSLSVLVSAQPAPNSDGFYQQLRNLSPQSGALAIEKVTLKRDAATFQLNSGVLCFTPTVNNKFTGAVFVGDGKLMIEPPVGIERATLSVLTKEKQYSESFDTLVLRFTDKTYEELKGAGKQTTGSCDFIPWQNSVKAMRKELNYNLDARILQDVVSPEPGGLFVAFVHGKKYDGKTLLTIDPHGAPAVYPEEVSLETYDLDKLGIWATFHYSSEYANGTAVSDQQNSVVRIEHQQLDTEIEKNGHLTGKAVITMVGRAPSVKVVPFKLFKTLRVSSVTGPSGEQLNFVQEAKTDDPQFWVILSKPIAKDERLDITVRYAGNDAIQAEGNGNYFPVARDDWYPNSTAGPLGEYCSYDMTFRIPKGMTMVATGTKVSDTTDGTHNVTVWKSDLPITVAGFNFGNFKREEVHLEKPPMEVTSFANTDPPDWVNRVRSGGPGVGLYGSGPSAGTELSSVLGSMNTTTLNKKALSEAQYSLLVYSEYFGALPFKGLSMTQQTATNFGQSWPTLVYLPMSYLLDETTRHYLGMTDISGYFTVVAPHEVAHQWWGHDVGFNSYRDQWMSEGFAEMSASLYIQFAYTKEPQRYTKFWNDELRLLTERNKEGYRPIDAGPLTLGYRMSNSREGFDVYRRLIYPKGAYVLQMVRMMMWDRTSGDARFKETMHDFVSTYSGKPATTEEFKTIVEKHMTSGMDLDGNHKLDWFFNEYVYGTQLPNYKFDYSFDPEANGDYVLNMKLAQSGVDANFRMLVPVYLELANGHVTRLGTASPVGNTTVEQKVTLTGVKDKPKRAMINYHNDVLATMN
jgi:hypothetical protein